MKIIVMVLLAIAFLFVMFNDVEALNEPKPIYYSVDVRLASILTEQEKLNLLQAMVNTYAETYTCDNYQVSVVNITGTEIVFQVTCQTKV